MEYEEIQADIKIGCNLSLSKQKTPSDILSGGDECVLFAAYILSFWFFDTLLLDVHL